MKGRGESHASSGKEMEVQQETEAVQRDVMQQPAGRAKERQRH
jgi:hypothetical protein